MSNWDSGVGIFWLSDDDKTYKVLVFKEQFEKHELPSLGEMVNWELQNFGHPENSINEKGDSVKWHPGDHWPRCWTDLRLIICPDSDSTFLYLVKS